jgi:thioesterase domain-containing protein
MAEIHLRAVRQKQPHGPYILGGTCNGGLVAFEMARLLRAAGERIDLLILIGASASNLRSRWLRSFLVSTLAPLPQGREIGGRIFGHFIRLRRIASKLIRVTPRRNLQTIRKKLSAAVRSPQRDLAPASRSSVLALASKYQQIDRQYIPSHFAGKVTIFWSAWEVETPQAAASAWRMVADDVELHVLPGEHHEKALSEHESTVAELIKSCMQAVESRAGKVLPAAGSGNDRSASTIGSELATEHG